MKDCVRETLSVVGDLVSNPILLVDGRNTIIYRNAAAKELFGSVEEGTDQFFGRLLSNDSNINLVELFRTQDLLEDHCAFCLLNKNRQRVPVSVSWKKTGASSESEVGAFIILYELSLEHRLFAHEVRAEQHAVLTQLVKVFSHDFNNALGVLSGTVAVMRRTLPADPEVSRRLDILDSGLRRAEQHSDELEQFSPAEEPTLEFLPVHLLQRPVTEALRALYLCDVVREWQFADDLHQVRMNLNQMTVLVTGLIELVEGNVRITAQNLEIVERDSKRDLDPGYYVQITVIPVDLSQQGEYSNHSSVSGQGWERRFPFIGLRKIVETHGGITVPPLISQDLELFREQVQAFFPGKK